MNKQFKKRLFPCIVAAILLCGCAGAAEKETGKDSGGQGTGKTSGAEEKGLDSGIVFEGQDMEGNTVSSDIFSESRVTMVNVWATYCSPCLNEMPELGELAKEYDSEDFQVIGIVSNVPEGADEEELGLVEVLIGQTGADYPHLLLSQSLNDGLLADVMAVPTTFFFDREGKLLDTVVGAKEKSAWKEMIDGFLEE